MLFQALAVVFAVGCAGFVLMPRRVPPRIPADSYQPSTDATARTVSAELAAVQAEDLKVATAPSAPGAKVTTAPAAAAASTRPVTPRRKASKRPDSDDGPKGESDPDSPLAGFREGEITAGEYIQALHDAGIYTGIGAFNPPGTSPPLEGLAVPEDYPLPEGYVRHYQTTDDGQPIEPILMYSPDFEFFDANGNPVPIPDDRVVPPEHVPPGFPVRQIEMPPKREPGDLSR